MHRIRLRGPWQRQAPDGSRQRVSVPETEITGDTVASGKSAKADRSSAFKAEQRDNSVAVYHRKFNRPTGLDDNVRVELSILGWMGTLERLRLNQRDVSVGPPPWRVDVTDLLQPHNRLELTLSAAPPETPSLSGEVALIIHDGDR